MKKYNKISLVFLLMLSLVVFAGCGAEKPEDKGASGEAGQEAKNVLVVGTEPTFPPFEMMNDKGDIIGFDIDLIKAIGEDQGFEVQVQNLEFDALVMSLQNGNIDAIAAGMTISPDRAKEVDFSKAYIDAGLAIAVVEGNEEIKGLEDLQGKVIAAQNGTTGALTALELKDQGIIKDFRSFSGVDMAMMELVNGGVDAVINDIPVTEAYMEKQPGKIKMVGEPIESAQFGFAVKKGNAELLEKINTGLQNVIDNGTYDELHGKYFGE